MFISPLGEVEVLLTTDMSFPWSSFVADVGAGTVGASEETISLAFSLALLDITRSGFLEGDTCLLDEVT